MIAFVVASNQIHGRHMGNWETLEAALPLVEIVADCTSAIGTLSSFIVGLHLVIFYPPRIGRGHSFGCSTMGVRNSSSFPANLAEPNSKRFRNRSKCDSSSSAQEEFGEQIHRLLNFLTPTNEVRSLEPNAMSRLKTIGKANCSFFPRTRFYAHFVLFIVDKR